ncbi:MAG TPA: VCBS repeat-containing protein [Candidatus Angelobacter sp.]|nr:VCBS repeat-containing protein [Candidatus Angelobacter sp.]
MFCAALALIATALVLATPGFAQVSFNPSVHSSPNIPTDIFQVKLNQLGKPDLITTQAGSNSVSVFLNDGNGNFPAGPSATYLTGGVATNSVAAADFNEDGFPDLATANCGNTPDPPQTPVPSSVSILFNNGDRTFKPHQDYPLPACPDSIGTLIASPESLFSLIVSYGGSNITLLMNNGLGQFSERTIAGPAGSQIRGVSAADYNGDGLDDIAAIMNGNSVVIFYQNPDGSFQAPTTIFSKTATLIAANTVGFNATGRPDLLVPFTNAPGEPPGVIAFTNNGGGNFSALSLHVDAIYGDMGHKAAEGDLQGTGLHSIILPVAYSTQTSLFSAFAVFTQPSKGVWNGPIYLAGDNQGTAAAAVVAEFNGDNRPDIAGAGGEDSHMFVFMNATSARDCGFFSGGGGVRVCSPTAGSTVSSPVAINASSTGGSFPIVAMKAYIDGTQVSATETNTMNASVAKAVGNHQLAVNAWDSNDKVYQTIVNFTVGGTTACSVPTAAGIHICAPTQGSSVTSPVAVSAAANGGTAKISTMKAYIDGKQVAASSSGTISGSAAEAVGTHKLVVNAWNTAGKLFQSSATFTVH